MTGCLPSLQGIYLIKVLVPDARRENTLEIRVGYFGNFFSLPLVYYILSTRTLY